MRKAFKKILCILLALCLTAGPAFAAGGGTGEAVYENTLELAEGFTYTNSISYKPDGKRAESYAFDCAPNSAVYPIVMACDTIYGGMDMSEITAYAESLGLNVVGAVNSDFFYTSSHVPVGIVIEDGIYKSSPDGNNAVAFSDEGAAIVSHPAVTISLSKNGDLDESETVSLTHYNKVRTSDGLYLYSEYFSTVSTRTTYDGWMVKFRILEGEMTTSGEMELEVISVKENVKSDTIGEGCLVLTASNSAGMDYVLDAFHVGDRFTLSTSCSSEEINSASWACGVGDILLSEGSETDPAHWNKEISEQSHPRTALGVRPDGSAVFYVLDGRSSASSGATLEQLCLDLRSMGCEYAANLDGGGSSMFSLRLPGEERARILNRPSDGKERDCATYILFVTDGKTGGAETLHIGEDGAFVLAGASLNLTPLASDAALLPAALNGEVNITAANGKITRSDSGALVYTAPENACTDVLELKCGSASGTATLHIIERADEITVGIRDGSASIKNLTLKKNGQAALTASFKRLGRPVYSDSSVVSFECSDNVGTIDESGLFTASGEGGAQGSVTVSGGGLAAVVPVQINFELLDIEGHWCENYVRPLFLAGIVNGVSDTAYSPDVDIKRGDFMLMLCRAAGNPEFDGETGFGDVERDAYFADAIGWARSVSIANGFEDGTFRPNDSLTREQAFTFLCRALPVLGKSVPEPDLSLLEQFADSGDIAEYAREATSSLIALGAVSGDGSGLAPRGSLTRAAMAKILCVSLGMSAETDIGS